MKTLLLILAIFTSTGGIAVEIPHTVEALAVLFNEKREAVSSGETVFRVYEYEVDHDAANAIIGKIENIDPFHIQNSTLNQLVEEKPLLRTNHYIFRSGTFLSKEAIPIERFDEQAKREIPHEKFPSGIVAFKTNYHEGLYSFLNPLDNTLHISRIDTPETLVSENLIDIDGTLADPTGLLKPIQGRIVKFNPSSGGFRVEFSITGYEHQYYVSKGSFIYLTKILAEMGSNKIKVKRFMLGYKTVESSPVKIFMPEHIIQIVSPLSNQGKYTIKHIVVDKFILRKVLDPELKIDIDSNIRIIQ